MMRWWSSIPRFCRAIGTLGRRMMPKRLTAQIVLVALLGLIISLAVASALAVLDRGDAFDNVLHDQAGDVMVGAIGVLDGAPVSAHASLARRLSTSSMTFTTGAPVARRTNTRNPRLARLANYIRAEVGDTISQINIKYDRPFRRYWRRKGPPVIVMSAKLINGPWINARYRFRGAPLEFGLAFVGLLASFVAVLALGVTWLMGRAMKPVRRLADSAAAFGRGEAVTELALEGPADIQNLTQAFNTMQRRIKSFVDDRTTMLAAISHDLRTPITALRIRAEMIEDEEARMRMIEQLDDMQKMTEAALAFAREDGREEELRRTDLGALVGSICADMEDMGRQVTLTCMDGVVVNARPIALKRAVRNLVENACLYGERADVEVVSGDATVDIIVNDWGPGIAADQQERMFEPFTRLEGSRSRETGGSGLGLAIARSIARAHGGDVNVFNRHERGLRAVLTLPRR